MNAETLEALKGSINKWEDICFRDGEDVGSDNCPLCQKFFLRCNKGCPVHEITHNGCYNSPWEEWFDHQLHEHHVHYMDYCVRKIRCPECKRLAERELEFLKSLLPKEQS